MTWVYAGGVSPERRYQLQNAEANQQIDALLERPRRFGELRDALPGIADTGRFAWDAVDWFEEDDAVPGTGRRATGAGRSFSACARDV